VAAYPPSVNFYGTLEKARGALAFRDQIVNVVVSRKELSESYFSPVRSRLPRLYDLWRGYYTGKYSPHRNNVHIPLIFSTIESDVARKVAASFSLWPVVQFMGFGPNDAPIARKQEALVAAQMKDYKAFEKEMINFLNADLFGVGITQLGWNKQEEDAIIIDASASPITGEMIRQVRKQRIITFDGPDVENVDRLDFYPQPGFREIDKMAWVIRRYFLDLDDVRALGKAGMFDQGEIERLEREGNGPPPAVNESFGVAQFMGRTAMDESSARNMDQYFRPVEILEMWGRIPSELATDGDTNRVISVANGRFLLRNKPNPYWHRRKPFHAFSPTPDPVYFDAPGKAEIAEKLQIVANRFVNQTLDATDIVIDPMHFFDRNAGLKTRGLFARPGRFIPVDGNPAERIMPYAPDLRGVQLGTNKTQEMWSFMQMGTGIVDDAVMGLGGSDRQTAREYVGRREAAGTRLQLESRIYEETYLEPLANKIVALNKQFLTKPVEVLMLGESAIMDPVTNQPIPTGREWVSNLDMLPNYTARAYGASTALSRGERKNNMLQLAQTIMPVAGQLGAMNMMNFFRQMLREFEVPNINEIMAVDPRMQQLMQQAQAQPGQPTATNQGGGNLSEGGLPPELAGMMGAQG